MPIQVGDESKTTLEITDQLIRDFAQLSGDNNPIHLDDEFAAKTRFKKRIAHGMLPGIFISKALANELPGPGTVYMGQTLKFVAPVYIGDTLTIELKVLSIRDDKPIATIETLVRNQSGGLVVKGEATAFLESLS